MARYEVTVREEWVVTVRAATRNQAKSRAHEARQAGEGDLEQRWVETVDGASEAIGFVAEVEEEVEDDREEDE